MTWVFSWLYTGCAQTAQKPLIEPGKTIETEHFNEKVGVEPIGYFHHTKLFRSIKNDNMPLSTKD